MLTCDFCGRTPITARFAAQDFSPDTIKRDLDKTHIEFHAENLGEWSACVQCEMLIDAKDWDSLITRGIAQFLKSFPHYVGKVPEPVLKDHLKHMYERLLTMKFKKISIFRRVK